MPKEKETTLVLYRAGEPYTTSEIISQETGIARRKIRDAIKKHEADISTFGKVASYEATLQSGQRATGYRLNEQQATFLLTLLKNTPTVVAFKKELVRQFYAMRSFILEQQSPIWQNARTLAKEVRRIETDAIRDLVEYAQDQGSKNAQRYYISISNLANKTVGITDRDMAHTEQLTALMLVERAMSQEIQSGIQAGKPYKEIYTNLQERMNGLAALIAP